jgi:hypothetical protein
MVYKNIVEEKTNALLLDEDGFGFYHYNLGIMPAGAIICAYNYLDSIISILGKYNVDICRDLRKTLKSLHLIKPEHYLSNDEKEQIEKNVKKFEISSTEGQNKNEVNTY